MKKILLALGAIAALSTAACRADAAEIGVKDNGNVVVRQHDGHRIHQNPRVIVKQRYYVGGYVPSYAYVRVDPSWVAFRLGPVPRGRQWVRVGDDLLLIDRRGRVIRVVYNVF